MKKTILILICATLPSMVMLAQEKKLSKKFGVGFQLNQYQKDFGLGVNVTSPYFLYKALAIRVRGNFMWNEHPGTGTNMDITWSPYTNVTVGVVAVGGEVANFLRLYGEGGVLFIFPNSDISTSTTDVGGYGLFGFEFFFDSHVNYFIELGGIGSGANADKVLSNPIYSNGFLASVGFRIQL